MNIGYFGDGPWAHIALQRIMESEELCVAFIVARYTNPDPVLRQMAGEQGVPFAAVKNVNDPAFLSQVEAWDPDLNVSMSFDQILRRPLLGAADGGFINCHAGALPFYRGRNVLNWSLINGASEIGVTVHYVDEGIDTGDIILQRSFPVGADDDYATVLKQAAELCALTLTDALHQIAHGAATVTPQRDVHPVGMYCSRRRAGDEWIDWSWSSQRIHDFVRALAPPGPGARTLLGEEMITVTRTRRIPRAPEYIDRPGTVVGRDQEGVTVKTGDTTIHVTRVGRPDGASTTTGGTPNYAVGTFFGINLWDELLRLRQRVNRLERLVAGNAED